MKIEKGKPIVLPDGTEVLPAANAVGSKVVTKADKQAAEQHEKLTAELEALMSNTKGVTAAHMYKRTLAEVDSDFDRMNVTMLVLAYTVWGLEPFAISRLLKVDPSRIDAVMMSDLYTRLQTELVEAMRYAEEATVHGFLAGKAMAAAVTVASSLTNPSADVKLTAARDLLDRAGFRPVDRVEHSVKFDDEMRIRLVTDDNTIPKVNFAIGE